MSRKFMVDIETTGVDLAKDEILQVAFLELNFDGKFWVPGKSLNLFQHTEREPESEFAKTHMAKLYAFCKTVEAPPVEAQREQILKFFRECGAEPPMGVFLAGHNAPTFDIPFLVRDGFIQPNHYVTLDGKDVMVGDFHYRKFDLNSAIEFVVDSTGGDRKTILELASNLKVGPQFDIPGDAHDALADCYSQTKLWNGLLALSRCGFEASDIRQMHSSLKEENRG